MIRSDEHVTLFPTLARVDGRGRAEVALHGVIFRPAMDSVRRTLLVRAIARAAGVRHDTVVGPRLAERLWAFLVDNKRGRTIRVRVGERVASLGPSTPSGHLRGRVLVRGDPGATMEIGTHEDEAAGRIFPGRVHLLSATGLSVVCDVDDTIKHSNVPDTRDLLRNTFLRPYRPIQVVAEVCRSLAAAGASFHYVSASPWQLFPALDGFMHEHDLPRGSFHLKRFRIKDRSAFSLLASPERFKPCAIEPLLGRWPRRRFVLIGDSAEHDPEIYGDLARRFPATVAAVLVRDTTGDARGGSRYRRAFAGVSPDRWSLVADSDDWSGAAAWVLERATSRGR